MASPVGHSLIGVGCNLLLRGRAVIETGPAEWKYTALFVMAANLPDIDFLIGYAIYGNPNAIHSGWTHSLLFCVLASMVLPLFNRLGLPVFRAGIAYFVTVLSHDGVDLLTGPAVGLHPSYGVPLLWPFYGGKITVPFSVFPGVRHRNLDQLLSPDNFRGAGYEVLLLLPVIVLLFMIIRRGEA